MPMAKSRPCDRGEPPESPPELSVMGMMLSW